MSQRGSSNGRTVVQSTVNTCYELNDLRNITIKRKLSVTSLPSVLQISGALGKMIEASVKAPFVLPGAEGHTE